MCHGSVSFAEVKKDSRGMDAPAKQRSDPDDLADVTWHDSTRKAKSPWIRPCKLQLAGAWPCSEGRLMLPVAGRCGHPRLVAVGEAAPR